MADDAQNKTAPDKARKPSFLDDLKISVDIIKSATFGIIYGDKGVGKTFLCAKAPMPFYICVEKGAEKVKGIGRFTKPNEVGTDVIYLPQNADEFFAMLKKLRNRRSPYKTVVIDSGMFVDKLFVADVIAKNPFTTKKVNKETVTVPVTSLADFDFTFGYDKVMALWDKFLTYVDMLHALDINVILISHARTKDVIDKSGDKYPKWQIDMIEYGQVSIPRLLSNRADYVFFMEAEVSTSKKAKTGFERELRTVANDFGPGDIKVYTRGTSRFNAKVRATIASNIENEYVIDIYDDATSQRIFDDLVK